MNNISKIALPLFTLAFSANLYALIHIEPLIGTRMGGSEEFFMTSIDGGSYERSGNYLGGRLGISLAPGFVFGGDFRMGELESNKRWGEAVYNDLMTYDTSALGVFFLYALGPSVKIWGTYYFKNIHEMTSEAVDSGQIRPYGLTKGTTLTGKKYAMGMGYEVFPFVNINLEYSISKFETITYPNIAFFTRPDYTWRIGANEVYSEHANLPDEFAGSEFVLSISFPLEIAL